MKSRKGFTLIELLVVVAITGIILAGTMGLVQAYLLNIKIGATVENIHQGLVRAKLEAIKRNMDVVFTVDTGGGFVMTLPNMDARNTDEITLKAEAEASLLNKVVTVASVAVTNEPDSAAPLPITFTGSGRPRDNASVTYRVTPIAASMCKTVAGEGDITCKTVEVSSGGQIKICNPTASNTQYRC